MSSSDDSQHGIRNLSQQECIDLLQAAAIGRVGFVSSQGVEILPVGYRVGDGPRLFVATQPWGVLGQLAESGTRCSFQVDYHGTTSREGWSVLMRGALTRLDRQGRVAYTELTRSLEAWPGYRDAQPVQFVPVSYSGRSVRGSS